jgi:hypothetical protein
VPDLVSFATTVPDPSSDLTVSEVACFEEHPISVASIRVSHRFLQSSGLASPPSPVRAVLLDDFGFLWS